MVPLSPSTIPLHSKRQILKLVRNPTAPDEEQPSDFLLREHFRQALFKYVLGDGTVVNGNWGSMCESILFEDESIDLSKSKWITGIGKEIVERYLAMQLFGCLPSVLLHYSDGSSEEPEGARWSRRRREYKFEFTTPPEPQEWPESYRPDFEFDYPTPIEFDPSQYIVCEDFSKPYPGYDIAKSLYYCADIPFALLCRHSSLNLN